MERICDITDVDEGSMKGFEVNEKKILLAHIDGNFYAVDAVCTHRGGYLPDGKISGKLVICPVHGTQYDLTTGKVFKNVSRLMKYLTGEATDLNKYEVSIEGDSVFIEI
jgi:nitrite reductase/ring-hydroxylating ferredoxin subunit